MTSREALDAIERSSRIEKYLSGERSNLAMFLVEMAEFDRLGQYRELGYGSLWSYCHRHLRLPKGQCTRRTTAVSLLQRFPQIIDHLRDGRHCMSTVSALKDALTSENVHRLLDEGAWKTVEEVEYLAACQRPKQQAPEATIRKVPESKPASRPEATAPAAALTPETTAATFEFSAPPAQGRVEIRPVCEDLFLLKVPLTLDRKKKLERVTDILGHAVPSGKVEDVLEHLFDLAIAREEKRRKGPGQPKVKPKEKAASVEPLTAAGNRAGIPIDVQRFVWERDQGRCTFTMPGGERCKSEKLPQFHHEPEVTRGGKNIPEHLSIHCREHNALKAVRTYGARFMAKFTKRGSAGGPRAGPS